LSIFLIQESRYKSISLVDFFLIVTFKVRNRPGKVAKIITAKGYCSTKNMYYHVVKLHAIAFRRKGSILFPEYLMCSSASVNDLLTLNLAFGNNLKDRVVFSKKNYSDKDYFQEKEVTNNLKM
jgi:hypothetical protein